VQQQSKLGWRELASTGAAGRWVHGGMLLACWLLVACDGKRRRQWLGRRRSGGYSCCYSPSLLWCACMCAASEKMCERCVRECACMCTRSEREVRINCLHACVHVGSERAAACRGKPMERRENRVLASLGWKDRGESSSGRRLPAASLPALLCLRWVREEQQLLVCSVERRRAVSKKSSVACGGKKNQSSWCAVLLLPRGLLSMTERE